MDYRGKSISILSLSLGVATALGHEKKHSHASQEAIVMPTPVEIISKLPGIEARTTALAAINAKYVSSVKAILLQKCGDCHSHYTNFPWYYSIPGVKYFIEKDIADAREHIDISSDFPFVSHGAPEDDLEVIRSAATDDTMPPWTYRLMHSDSVLTIDEIKAIVTWVDEGFAILKDSAKGQISDETSKP